jgi:hypothetical protein
MIACKIRQQRKRLFLGDTYIIRDLLTTVGKKNNPGVYVLNLKTLIFIT